MYSHVQKFLLCLLNNRRKINCFILFVRLKCHQIRPSTVVFQRITREGPIHCSNILSSYIYSITLLTTLQKRAMQARVTLRVDLLWLCLPRVTK